MTERTAKPAPDLLAWWEQINAGLATLGEPEMMFGEVRRYFSPGDPPDWVDTIMLLIKEREADDAAFALSHGWAPADRSDLTHIARTLVTVVLWEGAP